MKQTMHSVAWLLVGLLAVSAGGCEGWDLGLGDEGPDDEKTNDPRGPVGPDVEGTVAEVAMLVRPGEAPMTNVGIVIGLVDKGSSEIPPQYRGELVAYAKRVALVGRPSHDTGEVSAIEFLQDRDTALVVAQAIIPPGAPKGTRIDVGMRVLPRSQTQSLVGGMLMPTELQWARGAAGRDLKAFVRAEGDILTNPFINPDDPSNRHMLLTGRVPNGGVVLRDMPLRLQLIEPDYTTVALLQRRINERFGDRYFKVAVGKNRYYLELNIPPAWRGDYKRFLSLVMHLPRAGREGAYEKHARRVAEQIQRDGVNRDGLALIWEAMGASILPIVQHSYASEDPSVRFYAARAGLRMGDERLAGPLMIGFADDPRSPHRIEAIVELGRRPDLLQAGPVLRNLLNVKEEDVRIAAYEALLARGGTTLVQRTMIDGEFYLDRVQTEGDFVIYATVTGQPKIVLFGKDMPVNRNAFFQYGKDVTVFAADALPPDRLAEEIKRRPWLDPGSAPEAPTDDGERIDLADLRRGEIDQLRARHLEVTRRIQEDDYSESFFLPFRVHRLIDALSSPPRPHPQTAQIQGLGLSYGQTLAILRGLCKDGSVPAKFVLQPLPPSQKIDPHQPTTGRPDQ